MSVNSWQIYSTPIPSNLGYMWLDTSKKPYKGYRCNGSSWTPYDFTKIGEVQRVNTIMGAPISYAFNGRCEYNTLLTKGAANTINHNIGTYKFYRDVCFYSAATGWWADSYQSSSVGTAFTNLTNTTVAATPGASTTAYTASKVMFERMF